MLNGVSGGRTDKIACARYHGRQVSFIGFFERKIEFFANNGNGGIIMSSQQTGKIPKVGVLVGGDVDTLKTGYTRWLYDYFADLALNGHWVLQVLGHKALAKGSRVPWDLEPLERGSLSPGPMPDDIRAHQFDGLIALQVSSHQYLAEVAKLGPLLVLDSQVIGVNCDSVIFDGLKAGFQIGQHLAASGHRDILFASAYTRDMTARQGAEEYIEDDASIDRRLGILNGIEGTAATLWPTLPVKGSDSNETLKARVSRFLESTGRVPDALAGHDTSYVGRVSKVLEQLGLKIPGQVSVIAFDADPPLVSESQHISHLQFPWRDMAAAGWKLLSSRMNDPKTRYAPPRVERVTGQFIDRGSVVDRRARREHC